LCGIQAASYIVIVGIAKPSGIAETDEPAMPGRKPRKQVTRNKN
jgi:hypothetical protein